MTEYAQFCALARAAEVVGERWTLLILRELWLGPKRFSDLKERLQPITPGVLNGRLRALEARGVIARREVAPPTPARLYELTPAGQELGPVLLGLLRWGARYLLPPRPGERFEPDWLRMVFAAYAVEGPVAPGSIGIRVIQDGGSVAPAAWVEGGPHGVLVGGYRAGADAEISAPAAVILGVLSRGLSLEAAEASGAAIVTGDREVAAGFASLFANADREGGG